MAQETVGITIRINGQDKVLSSIGEIKKELKFAEEQAKFFATQGEKGAAQFQNYAQVVKQLKGQVEDSTKAVQQFSGEGKLDAVIGSVRGIAGAFTAVQGALGAVGVQGEAVQNTLLKVQSALAISEGLKSVQEGIKSFKDLGKIITGTTIFQRTYNFVMYGTATATLAADTATKKFSLGLRLLRGLMASIGIGALIFGITVLVDKISKWTSSTEDNKRAQERLNSALEAQEKIFSQQKESLARQREIAVKRAELAGKNADEIFKINQDYNKKDREAAVDNFKKNLAALQTFEKEKLKRRKDGNLEGSEEDIKAYNQAKAALEKANKEIKDIDFQNQKDDLDNKIRVNQEKLKNDEEAAAKSKTLAEKEAERLQKEREERLQAEKDAAQKILDLQDEVFLQSIQDETQRSLVKLSQDKERQINEINATKATAEQKAKQVALIEQKFQQDKIKIEEDAAKERKEKEAKDAEETAARLAEKLKLENDIRVAAIKDEFERKKAELLLQEEQEKADLQKKREENLIGEDIYQQGLLNIKDKYIKAETDLKDQQADNEKKILASRQEGLLQFLDATASSFGALSNLFDQGTAASKAFALAEIAINAGTGFARGLSIAQQTAAAGGPSAAFVFPIFYATQVAAVLNAINKARSILKTVKGPSASGSISAPNIAGTGSAPIAPQSPQAALTRLDQATINQLGSASNRAYVVESDITNSQERITRINRAARLN